jgi:hypothetical protein
MEEPSTTKDTGLNQVEWNTNRTLISSGEWSIWVFRDPRTHVAIWHRGCRIARGKGVENWTCLGCKTRMTEEEIKLTKIMILGRLD